MHGRPRSQKHKVNGDAERKRAALYASLVKEALGRFRRWTDKGDRAEDDEELMKMAAAVIEVNPECYSMWAIRKQMALWRLSHSRPSGDGGETDDGQADAADAAGVAGAEMELSERALRRNVKSYSAWYHRKWVIEEERMAPHVSLSVELALVDKLLAVDSRNFHAWGYRRFVAQKLGRSVGDELQYTLEQIERNFSNYSAWHYRSVLMSAGTGGEVRQDGVEPAEADIAEARRGAAASSAPGSNVRLSSFSSSMAVPLTMDVLRREFSLVQQALYTEPSDQSGWFYENWLQGCCLLLKSQTDGGDGWRALLSGEADACREIIQEERESIGTDATAGGGVTSIKWPTLALARLIDVGAEAGDGETPEALYSELRAVDAQRAGMYDALVRARQGSA